MELKRATLALLLAAALAAAGCAAAVGAGLGAGGYKYVSGEFDTTYRQPYNRVYDATVTSIKDMNISVTKVQRDALGAKIDAKRADGTDVNIKLDKAGPDTTNAAIRVGTFGDEQASKVIADNIAKRLGESERTTGRGGEAKGQGGS